MLVVVVVYVFLQSFRSTIICMIAVFVSLIGTAIGMLALGFSINLLTLFGIVLAIGMVVDDAIVVVENVEGNMVKAHLPPKEATIKAMEQIGTLAHRRRVGHGVGLYPGGVSSRHHGPALQAVRDHHRHLRGDLRLRGADADPGDVRSPAQAYPAARSAAPLPGSTGSSTVLPRSSAPRWC